MPCFHKLQIKSLLFQRMHGLRYDCTTLPPVQSKFPENVAKKPSANISRASCSNISQWGRAHYKENILIKASLPFNLRLCHVRYVLIIQASVESSPKMIQLNIQIKIQFLVVIQRAGQNLCACQRNLQSYQ